MTTPFFHHPTRVLDSVPRTHRRLGVVPSGDDSLRYVLPIPRDWGRVTALGATPGVGRCQIIGAFSATADLSGPRIIVSAMQLRYDVDPCQWLRHGWEAAGWTVALAGPLEPRWAPRFEVGGLRRTEGSLEVRRATGFVDNGRLIRLDVASPASAWPGAHDLTWPCGVLMALAKPTFRRDVEARRRYSGPHLAFELPRSWEARPNAPAQRGACRWLAQPLEGEQGAVMLRIDASPWRPGAGPLPIEERHRRLRRELRREGISMARRTERQPTGETSGLAGLAGVFRAAAQDHDNQYELHMAHRDIDGTSVDYAMLVTSPAECVLDRLRARRALEIAIATTELRPDEETLTHGT